MTIDKQDVLATLAKVRDQGLVLLVSQRDDDGITPRRLLLDNNAGLAFGDQCNDATTAVAENNPIPYTASAELDTGEFFLIQSDHDLAELGALRSMAVDVAARERIEPSKLDTGILLYGVVLGNEERVAFVRRADPRLTHRRGRFMAIGQERLAQVNGPVFSFSPGFDFILTQEWAVVLNQGSFEKLFRESGLVKRNIETWVSGITDHLTMADADVEALTRVALRDSRTWRRLRDIQRRGHLAQVGLDDVSAYARRMGLDESKIVRDGRLVFDEHERFSFLQLLGEDLYRGELTDQVFEAQRKESI